MSSSSSLSIRNRDVVASIFIVILIKLCHFDHEDAWIGGSKNNHNGVKNNNNNIKNFGSSISASIYLGFYSNYTATTATTTATTNKDNNNMLVLARPVTLDIDGDGIHEALIVPYRHREQQPPLKNDKNIPSSSMSSTSISFGLQILDLKPLFRSTSTTSNKKKHNNNMASKSFLFPPIMSVLAYNPNDDDDEVTNHNHKIYNVTAPLWIESHHVSLASFSSIFSLEEENEKEKNENNNDGHDKKRHYYCGTSWHDASERCNTPCPDFDCPVDGESCYADTPCFNDDMDDDDNKYDRDQLLEGVIHKQSKINPFHKLISSQDFISTPHNTLPCITTLWNHGSITLHCYTNSSSQQQTEPSSNNENYNQKENINDKSSSLKWFQVWNSNPFSSKDDDSTNIIIHWQDFNVVISDEKHSIFVAATYTTIDSDEHINQEDIPVEEKELTSYFSLDIYTGEYNWLHHHPHSKPSHNKHNTTATTTTTKKEERNNNLPGMARRRSNLYHHAQKEAYSQNEKNNYDLSESCTKHFRHWTLQYALPHVYWNPIKQQKHSIMSSSIIPNSNLRISHLDNRRQQQHPSNTARKNKNHYHHQQQQQHKPLSHTTTATRTTITDKYNSSPLLYKRREHFLKKNKWAANLVSTLFRNKRKDDINDKTRRLFLDRNRKNRGKEKRLSSSQVAFETDSNSFKNKPPKDNVLVFHNKDGIHVRSLNNGKPVCHMTLLQNSLYADINEDGTIDQIQVRSKDNDQIMKETDLYIGEEIVHHLNHDRGNDHKQKQKNTIPNDPSCQVLAVSGIPARQQLFQEPLCMNTHHRHPYLSRHTSVASPLLLEARDDGENNKKYDLLFALNHGQVIRYDSFGEVKWKILNEKIHKYNRKTLPTWSSHTHHNLYRDNDIDGDKDDTYENYNTDKSNIDDSSSSFSLGGPTCALLDRIDFPIQKFNKNKHHGNRMILASSFPNTAIAAARPILVAGEDGMALLSASSDGRIMANTKFPQSSIIQPVLSDLNGDGVTDILIISQDAIWGFIVELQYFRSHNIMNRIMVGLLFFGLAFAVIINHASQDRSGKFLANRSTDSTRYE